MGVKTHNPTSDFFKDIRTGIKLKQVQRSLSQHPIPANDPTNDLLATIRVGVKLKQVQKSTLLPPMKNETPMSALLAKIQERKEECIRREITSVSIEQSEIDW